MAAGKAFGIDVSANSRSPYLARLFGARGAALACDVLGSEGDAPAAGGGWETERRVHWPSRSCRMV